MNIQIFGCAKSFDTKKAQRYFKERSIRYQYVDILRHGLSRRELESVKSQVGLDALINKKSREYQSLFIQYITADKAEESLFENPGLFNVPIVRNGRLATVGCRPDIWSTWE